MRLLLVMTIAIVSFGCYHPCAGSSDEVLECTETRTGLECVEVEECN